MRASRATGHFGSEWRRLVCHFSRTPAASIPCRSCGRNSPIRNCSGCRWNAASRSSRRIAPPEAACSIAITLRIGGRCSRNFRTCTAIFQRSSHSTAAAICAIASLRTSPREFCTAATFPCRCSAIGCGSSARSTRPLFGAARQSRIRWNATGNSNGRSASAHKCRLVPRRYSDKPLTKSSAVAASAARLRR